MSERLLRLILALPLVALLGAAMAVAAWPDGEVTGRDRELVARLTRGGAQRLEADGGHWTADAIDLADTGPATAATDPLPDAVLTAAVAGASAPSVVAMLDRPATRRPAGRRVASPRRDRAPPRR